MTLNAIIKTILHLHNLKTGDALSEVGLCEKAGLGANTVWNWKRISPSIHNVEAVLNTIGYHLIISPKEIPLHEDQYTINGTRGNGKNEIVGDNPPTQGTFRFVDGARDRARPRPH